MSFVSDILDPNHDEIDFDQYVVNAVLALAGAIILNVVIYLIADILTLFPEGVVNPENGMPIGMFDFFIATLATGGAGMIGFALLGYFKGRINRPIAIFRLLAIFVFVFSLVMPFTIVGVTLEMIMILYLTHLVVFALIAGWLPYRVARS